MMMHRILIVLSTLSLPLIVAQNACFESKEELMDAIDVYLQDPSPTSDIASTYGHPMTNWCVEKVTDFSGLFSTQQTFDEDLNGWETSQVTSMENTFFRCVSFSSASYIESWDVSNVVNFKAAFRQAVRLTGDLSSWDVSNGEDLSFMFAEAASISFDLSLWDVSKVQTLESFASAARGLNSDISDWDISKCTNFQDMFARGSGMSQSLCAWGSKIKPTDNVLNMFGIKDRTQSNCPDPWDPTFKNSPTGPFCWSCFPNANPDGTPPGTEYNPPEAVVGTALAVPTMAPTNEPTKGALVPDNNNNNAAVAVCKKQNIFSRCSPETQDGSKQTNNSTNVMPANATTDSTTTDSTTTNDDDVPLTLLDEEDGDANRADIEAIESMDYEEEEDSTEKSSSPLALPFVHATTSTIFSLLVLTFSMW